MGGYIIASPNEIKQLQEAEARNSRIARLKQVREQERILAVGRRSNYRTIADEAWHDVAEVLQESWSSKRIHDLHELEALKSKLMLQLGFSHRQAEQVSAQQIIMRQELIDMTLKRQTEEAERGNYALTMVELERQKLLEPIHQQQQLRTSIYTHERQRASKMAEKHRYKLLHSAIDVDLTAHERPHHTRPSTQASKTAYDDTMYHRDYVVTKVDNTSFAGDARYRVNAMEAAPRASAIAQEMWERHAERRAQYAGVAKERYVDAMHDVQMEKQKQRMYGLLEELQKDYIREKQLQPRKETVDSRVRLENIEKTFEKNFGIYLG
ncbi:hypothetical protein SmJEL517_g02856 [Synchytrium microbalum]|uniref:Uncharacterized protein n=1 Tax=Synchytrium microbalum TaxID=1806994 RepID=A0A507C9B8_9FUNG|nr:uncharacterized protein SmJEL517_g02856 [Synchytrium microbalum]TPX34586.1 hypothetical protein SmJEL517_g02856 [Synchytrium microbalum]